MKNKRAAWHIWQSVWWAEIHGRREHPCIRSMKVNKRKEAKNHSNNKPPNIWKENKKPNPLCCKLSKSLVDRIRKKISDRICFCSYPLQSSGAAQAPLLLLPLAAARRRFHFWTAWQFLCTQTWAVFPQTCLGFDSIQRTFFMSSHSNSSSQIEEEAQ